MTDPVDKRTRTPEKSLPMGKGSFNVLEFVMDVGIVSGGRGWWCGSVRLKGHSKAFRMTIRKNAL